MLLSFKICDSNTFEISIQGKIVLWVKKIRRRKRIVLHGKCLSPSGVVSSIPSLFNGLKWEEAVLDANIGIPENCHLCHIQRSGSTSPEPIFFEKKDDSPKRIPKTVPACFIPGYCIFFTLPCFCVLRPFTASLPRHCLSEKHQ